MKLNLFKKEREILIDALRQWNEKLIEILTHFELKCVPRRIYHYRFTIEALDDWVLGADQDLTREELMNIICSRFIYIYILGVVMYCHTAFGILYICCNFVI